MGSARLLFADHGSGTVGDLIYAAGGFNGSIALSSVPGHVVVERLVREYRWMQIILHTVSHRPAASTEQFHKASLHFRRARASG